MAEHASSTRLGSGTVTLEAEFCDSEAIGIEAHPFVGRIAEAKLRWRTNPAELYDYAISILKAAKNIQAQSELIHRFSRNAILPRVWPGSIPCERLWTLRTASRLIIRWPG